MTFSGGLVHTQCLSVACSPKGWVMEQATYSIQFSVDYPDRPLDRVTTFFRVFVAIPILIVLGSVSGATWRWTTEGRTMVAGADGSLLPVTRAAGVSVRACGFKRKPRGSAGPV